MSVYRGVRSWLAQTWDDVKASIDASVLGAARFLGLLYGPIDRSLRIDQALRKALRHRLPKGVGWRHALGGVTYLLFMILVVTGVLLSFYYRPSAQEAYPSIQHIVSHVTFGWLVRDLHVWSASLVVIVALAHMARVLFHAAYKPPRETNWAVGLLLLLVMLAFGATGSLLPWDQWAYWTVTEALDVVRRVPLIGGLVASGLRGDDVVSGATLSRYFALHVIVLPWAALALLMMHFLLVRRHGVATATGRTDDGGTPFFPDHLLRSFLVVVLALAVSVSLAALFPRPIGAPANPFEVPEQMVSTWVPVDVSMALFRHLGSWGFALFTLLGVALAVLPIFDRGPERRLRRRPVVAVLGAFFFATFVALWFVGHRERTLPPGVGPDPAMLENRGVVPPPAPLERLGPTPIQPGAAVPGGTP